MTRIPRLVTTVAMTVLFFELIVLKDSLPLPWSAIFDGVAAVLGVYLAVLVTRWFR